MNLAKQMNPKKMISLFMCFVFLFSLMIHGSIEKPQLVHSAPAVSKDSPISFTLIPSKDENVENKIKYSIQINEVYDENNITYKTLFLTYPKTLKLVATPPVGFEKNETQETGSATVAIKNIDDTINVLTATKVKDILEGYYFVLNEANVFPAENSVVGISANQNKIAFYEDEQGYLHYYQFVPWIPPTDGTGNGFKDWMQSYNSAKATTFKGPFTGQLMQGYLATITSEKEHAMIYNSIATYCGWLGGTRMVHAANSQKIQDSDTISTNIADFNFGPGSTEPARFWYWANGPEAWTKYDNGTYEYFDKNDTSASPLVFWNYPIYSSTIDYSVPGVYTNFNNPKGKSAKTGNIGTGTEPNGAWASIKEYVLQFAFNGNDFWNDYKHDYNTPRPDGSYPVLGYYVEFGGYPGDPNTKNMSNQQTDTMLNMSMPVSYEYRLNVLDGNEYQQIPPIGTNFDDILVGVEGEDFAVDPLNLAPEGYTFVGYHFVGDDLDKNQLSTNTSITGKFSVRNQKVIVLYELSKYTVYFDTNGGGVIDEPSKTVVYSQPYGTLPTPIRYGYDFEGWYTQGGNGAVSGEQVTEETMVSLNSDTTLFAKWVRNEEVTLPSPTINSLRNTATKVTGTGIPGATIWVIFPDDPVNPVEAQIDDSGNWSVPVGNHTINDNDTIYAYQEQDGVKSENVSTQRDPAEQIESPTIDSVFHLDEFITGTGTSGAAVTVVFNDDTTETTIVDDDGKWRVPTNGHTLTPNDVIVATQEKNGSKSNEATTTVFATIILPPTISPVSVNATVINGSGAYPNAIVKVTLNNGVVLETTAESNGTWSVPLNGNTLSIDDVITATQTFYGVTSEPTTISPYEEATYTLTYNANGAESGSAPDLQSYKASDLVTVLGNTKNMQKPNYTFEGWNTASDASGTSYLEGATFNMPENNITLFAQWKYTGEPEPTYYTLTYDANGAESGSAPSFQSYKASDLVTVLGNTNNMQKTNYTFKGWNTASDASGTSYLEGATFNMPNNNITLFALWKYTGGGGNNQNNTDPDDSENDNPTEQPTTTPTLSTTTPTPTPTTTAAAPTPTPSTATTPTPATDMTPTPTNTASLLENTHLPTPTKPATSTNQQTDAQTDQEQPSPSQVWISELPTDLPLGMVATNAPNVYALLNEEGLPMGYYKPIIKDDDTIEWLEVYEDGTPLSASKPNPKTGDTDYPANQLILIGIFAIALALFVRFKKHRA